MGNENDKIKSFKSAFSDATKVAKEFGDAIYNLEDAAVAVAQQFGQGRENVVNIKAALNDASDSLIKVGVSITEALAKAQKIQTDFSGAIGRNALLTADSFGKIQSMSDVTKVSVDTLTTGFADAGISIINAGEEMQKVVDTSRGIGVSTAQVSEMVVDNLKETSKFNFQGGVEGMAKMAAQAVNLRIDMSSTLKIAESLFDPEKAIDMAAAMQRLGVAQSSLLDPLRLMDLAQNDPAELQNQIAEMSKEFVRMNEKGQFEILPGAKRQLMEIGKELGYNNGELVKMALAGAELDDKLTKIKLPDTFTEEQKKFIANMATMGPGGEYKLKVDGTDVGLDKALDLFTKDENKLKEFMEAQKPKTMEELAKEQINIFVSMKRDSEVLTKAVTRIATAIGAGGAAETTVTGMKEVTSKLPDIFATQELSQTAMRKNTDEALKDVMSTLGKGEIGEAFNSSLDNLAKFAEKSFDGISARSKIAEEQLSKSENEAIMAVKGVAGAVADKFEKITGIKTGGKELIESNKEIKEASALRSINEKKEELEKITSPKSEYGTSSSKTELTYTGKIDLNINAPSGMSEADWKSLTDKLIKDEAFRQNLVTIVNNINGTKSPTELNKDINSVYKSQ
jgi:hypothetical protein